MPSSYSRVESDSLGATAVLLVGHACTLGWVNAVNTTGALAHIQLFNAALAADVTVGTTLPDLVITSPLSQAVFVTDIDCDFPLGIVAASTTTVTGNSAATQHLKIGVQ